MLKSLKILIWVLVGLALFVALDQTLVRVPLQVPGLAPLQTFYVDFRQRLLVLAGLEQAPESRSIDQLIESNVSPPAQKQDQATRYLYVDESGALQFADSLKQVPERYRKDAQPLSE